MNGKRLCTVLLTLVIAFGLAFSAMADDSIMVRKNISKTPAGETEKAGISMMYFYVPAQSADGSLVEEGITYTVGLDDGTTQDIDTRYYAKPLTGVYIDEESAEEIDIENADSVLGDSGLLGGIAMGDFDAFGALSLDDGLSWKTYNLSRSAQLSSFTLANGHPYPGAVHSAVQSTAGDRIMIAWISRYCDGGTPLYTYNQEEVEALQTEFTLSDLYLYDIWGVSGTQKSVDYTLQGFPDVGEIPYGCVWTARGQLLPTIDDVTGDTSYDIEWTKPERLTSGRRDPNRLEIDCRSGGGCVIVWQEDPEGLRPGQGLGPGEGWSGAVVNAKTDIWYSYVSWGAFDKVEDIDTTTIIDGDPATAEYVTLAEYTGDTMPSPVVPMSMPMRMTDNNMCKSLLSDPYCYVNFENVDAATGNVILDQTLKDGLFIDPKTAISQSSDSTFCTETVSWTNPGGTTLTLCQAKDGRVMMGRVGASRPRIGLYPVSELQEDGTLATYSYYLVLAYEESKALGDILSDPENTESDPIDIGKNVWYHSFKLFGTTDYPGNDLDRDFVTQGGMLNQPAINPETGSFFDFIDTSVTLQTWDDFELYETEIARRFALVAQNYDNIGDTRTTAFLIYKQGIINQGGPADVFGRRIVLPDDFDPTTGNPYAYEYMDCTTLNADGTGGWAYLPETTGDPGEEVTTSPNPNYLQGVCLSPAINYSGTTIDECVNAIDGDCTTFPWDFGISPFPKVTDWHQEGPAYNGGEPIDPTTLGNLDDQSWENPFDVSKGHRGFLDGDYLMVMYAWSPNWKSNSVGNDHYNLYVRRSFDGGQSFSTLPSDWLAAQELPAGVEVTADGTTTCETYLFDDGSGYDTSTQACIFYDAGAFEPGRNVSQLIGNKITVLDPRYTPTGGMKMMTVKNTLKDPITGELVIDANEAGLPYWDDAERDPSKFFVIFETGDNTTVAEGEAVPLDLYYSRATNYGDDYELDYEKSDMNIDTGQLEDLDEDGVIEQIWNWVENQHELLSGEAGMTASPMGTFMYTVWNQWQETSEEEIFDSDMYFRRMLYNDAGFGAEALPTAMIVGDIPDILVFGDTLELVGIGRDWDSIGNGIVEYKWAIGTKGEEYQYHYGQYLSIGVEDIGVGTHTISFSVLDDEGHWSTPVTFEFTVWPEYHQINIPMVRR